MHARRLLATLEDDDLCCLLSYSALREHCRNGRQRQQANAVAATCSAELVLRMYAAMDNSPVGQPVEKLLRLLNDRALQGQVTGVLALLEQQHQQQHGQQRPPPVLLARACQALHTELGKREERRAASWVVSLRRAQACTDDMHPPMSVSTAAVMIQAATRGCAVGGNSGLRPSARTWCCVCSLAPTPGRAPSRSSLAWIRSKRRRRSWSSAPRWGWECRSSQW
jgi:hypothetical protein